LYELCVASADFLSDDWKKEKKSRDERRTFRSATTLDAAALDPMIYTVDLVIVGFDTLAGADTKDRAKPLRRA